MTTPYIQDSLMDIGLKAILEQIRLEALAYAEGEGGDTSALEARVTALEATAADHETRIQTAQTTAGEATVAAAAAASGATNANNKVATLSGTVATDLAALHTSATSTLAKLDLDATVTDADYAATCAPAPITTVPIVE